MKGSASSGSGAETNDSVDIVTDEAFLLLLSSKGGLGASDSSRCSTTQPHQSVEPWSAGERPAGMRASMSRVEQSAQSAAHPSYAALARKSPVSAPSPSAQTSTSTCSSRRSEGLH